MKPEKTETAENFRVIFADFAVVKFQGVIESLTNEGVLSEGVTDVARLLTRLAEEYFDICVINLLLGGIGPFELIENVKKTSKNHSIKVIVITRQVHKVNIENTMRAGADDFIGEPFETTNLYNRVIYHLGQVRVIQPSGFLSAPILANSERYIELLLSAGESLSHTPRETLHDSIYKILNQLANLLGSNRTSLIIVDESSNTGVVLATSDDPKFYNFPVMLSNYPEVLHVIHTGSLIFVENVAQNKLTQKIKKAVKTISIESLMAFPVTYQSEVVGVLLIRRPETTTLPPLEHMRILQTMANLMAAHSNVAILLRRIYKGYKDQNAA